LRLLGWRYSIARDAWVHRIGGGHLGPVFRLAGEDGEPFNGQPDPSIYEAWVAAREARDARQAHERREAPVGQRAPLPRRSAPARPLTRVEVSLRPSEPPRAVVVDGRPPRRGIDPHLLRPAPVPAPVARRAASA
jgi:hypothetical protein